MLAAGIIEVSNSHMVRALRRVSIERAREELTYLRAEMRDRKAILGQMAE